METGNGEIIKTIIRKDGRQGYPMAVKYEAVFVGHSLKRLYKIKTNGKAERETEILPTTKTYKILVNQLLGGKEVFSQLSFNKNGEGTLVPLASLKLK
jgi:hypothetical protein